MVARVPVVVTPLVFVAAGGADGCGCVPGTGGVPGLLALLFALGPAEVDGVCVGTTLGAGFGAGVVVAAGAGGAGTAAAGAGGGLEAALAGAGVWAATGAGEGWPTVGFDAGGLLSFVLPGPAAAPGDGPLSGEVGAAAFCGGDWAMGYAGCGLLAWRTGSVIAIASAMGTRTSPASFLNQLGASCRYL